MSEPSMTNTQLYYNASVWRWLSVDRSCISGVVDECAWIAVENGRIMATSNVLPVPSKDTFSSSVNMNGKLIIPGLMDAHIHIGLLGESQYFVDLQGCYSIEDLKSKLLAHEEKYPDLPWIVGVNWDQTKLGRYPIRQDLDETKCNKPIYLWRACWHIGVANTIALKLAKVLDQDGNRNAALSLDIPGGVVELDEVTKIPTGILKETATELIVSTVAQHKTKEHKLKYLSEGMALCSRLGLTAVQTNDDHCYSVYQQLQRDGNLPLRVFLTPVYEELNHSVIEKDGIQDLPPLRPTALNNDVYTAGENSGDLSSIDSRLIVERVKVFSDGSLGAETAALRTTPTVTTPYGAHSGVLVHAKDSLTSIIAHTIACAYRIEIHAIGDAAAEQVLDCLEANLIRPEDSEGYRPIMTHCQVLGADLVERMAQRGVIANIQPSFVPTDMRWVQARLTAEKQQYSYAWKTLLAAGVHLAGGSDAPIESPSPFIGLYDAIHRSNRHRIAADQEETVFRPEEKLTFAEALWLYTIGAAYAAGCEHVLGQLETGFAADFVVIDPLAVNDNSLLHDMLPDMVVVGGNIIRTSTAFADESSCVVPPPKIVSTSHDAPYIPGKGGRIPRVEKYFTDTSNTVGASIVCDEENNSNHEAWCACILNGKYCLETAKLR